MYDDFNYLAITLFETNPCDFSEAPEPLDHWIVEDFEDILPSMEMTQ